MYVLSIADTLVSSLPWLFAEFFSEQCGRNIAEARVAPLAVVEAFDVFLYCCFRVSPGRVALMVHQLVFQAAPEALHGRVVVAVPPARHGWLHAELLHQFLIVVSAVLAATVGVVNQARRGAFVAHGLQQRRCRQCLRHALVHRVAHQLAGEYVLDAGQVKPALAGGHIGDVGHPGFVWPRRRKGLIEQVVGHRQVVIRVRGGLEFALLLAAQGELATQADDAVTAGREALCRQFWLHAQRAIGLPALRVHRLDGDLQAGVVLRPLRRFAACPGVETAARDVKDAAQDGDGIVESQRLHDRVPGSDSRAKYAAAFFTISRSMRASASSASPSFTLAKALTWIVRCWRVGSARPARCCARWSTLFGAMCWRRRSCMPTIPRSRCWRPVMAKPRRRGYLMLRIFHLSHATRLISDRQVRDILATSHRNNPDMGVTGVLVHAGRMFDWLCPPA